MDFHPVEFRERVVEAYKRKAGSYRILAERFGVGEASVKRWVWLERRQGDLRPAPKRGGVRSAITEADIVAMLGVVADATAGELAAEFYRRRRHRVHVSSIKRALRRYGYVVKKSADGRWRVSGRTSSRSAPPT